MITKNEDQTVEMASDGGSGKEQSLCVVGGGVSNGNHHRSPRSSTMKKSPRVGCHKPFALPPSTPRTLLPEIAGEKKNGLKGLALFGKAKELHCDALDSERHPMILPDHDRQLRLGPRVKFEPTRLEDYYNSVDGFQMEEFRQGGFSLMARGDRNSTTASFPTSRSVRSVCSSEDLIVTSIKLSPNEKENGCRNGEQPRVHPKTELHCIDEHIIELTPCRFLINGKEVKMPEVPPPSMRSIFKPYHNPQNGNKSHPRTHLRRPQRASPRPRTVPIGNANETTPHFVPIQLKKSNKVAFENYLNNSAKPKSATLHKRPDVTRTTPTRNKRENEDDIKDASKMQFDMKCILRKFSPGGQQTLAGRILDADHNPTDFLETQGEIDFAAEEISKSTLINQWLDDCEQQRGKKTLVLSFPSIGEEEEGEEE